MSASSVLLRQPYINVSFPVPLLHLKEAIGHFFAFLDLSDELKHSMDLNIFPLHRRGEVGYTRRHAQDGPYRDNKEFFHYHPAIWRHCGELIKNNLTIEQFLSSAQVIWESTYEVVQDVLGQLENEFPGTLAKVFSGENPHILLRFLRYDFIQSGLYLAKPHFDSGSFTLAIAESSPGLRIGTNPQDLALIEHCENQAIFMISANYKKIIDTNRLAPGWHDVIQLDETLIGQSFARWAIVAFIDGHQVSTISRDETHKWSELEEK